MTSHWPLTRPAVCIQHQYEKMPRLWSKWHTSSSLLRSIVALICPPVGAAQYDRGYHYHGHAHNLNYFCATPLFLSSPLPLTNAWTWHCTLILCLCHYCLSSPLVLITINLFLETYRDSSFCSDFGERQCRTIYLAFESMSIYVIQHYIAINFVCKEYWFCAQNCIHPWLDWWVHAPLPS